MVVPSLAIGGGVGVVVSGAFVWWELGRFATPQVAVTRFDERKLLTAYTVGLFVGVPLSVCYLLFGFALLGGALLGAAVLLLGLVGGAELAQWLALRRSYWKGPAAPFYALSLRAGIGGILVLAVVATYLGTVPIDPSGAAPAAAAVVAVLALEVTGGLVSIAPTGRFGRPGSRPLSGLVFGAVGVHILGLGGLAGPYGELAGAAVAFFGAATVYRRLRPLLAEIPPPGGTGPPAGVPEPRPYGRTPGGADGPNGRRP